MRFQSDFLSGRDDPNLADDLGEEPADEEAIYRGTDHRHHALGQSAASEAALAEMIESHGNKYASLVAEEAAFRGDTNRAFEWLEKAAQLRDPALGAIPLSPFCENLHKDSRWLPFLRKQGMAPEQLAAIEFDFTLPK